MSMELPKTRTELEGFEDIECWAQKYGTEIISAIDYDLATDESVIDESVEEGMLRYTTCLSDVLCSGDSHQSDPEARTTAYRSLHMARRMAKYAMSNKKILFFGDYYESLREMKPDTPERNREIRSALRDKISNDAPTFLAARPGIDGLIYHYLPEMDPSGNHERIARTVVGLVLMHADDYQRAEFIDTKVDAWSKQLADSPQTQ